MTLTATDSTGASSSSTATVTVVDQAPAVLTLKPAISMWPPNHNYHTVTMAQMVQSVSDGCSTVSINDVVIEKVTSDEPDDAVGDADGITINDIVIAPDCRSVQLRAERDETKNGRVYAIRLRLKDAAGNITRQDFLVSIPISQNGVAAVLDAAAQTAASSCQ